MVGVAHPLRQISGALLAPTAVHFALNFCSVLFLKAIVLSQRIFSVSKKLKISKLGEVLFNYERKM